MEALISFILWVGFVLLLTRLRRGSHLFGQEYSGAQSPNQSHLVGDHELRWVPPVKDVDPACGKTVTTEKAKPSVYAGKVYYFCSRECREIFEAAPDLYVGHRPVNRPELEHSHV